MRQDELHETEATCCREVPDPADDECVIHYRDGEIETVKCYKAVIEGNQFVFTVPDEDTGMTPLIPLAPQPATKLYVSLSLVAFVATRDNSCSSYKGYLHVAFNDDPIGSVFGNVESFKRIGNCYFLKTNDGQTRIYPVDRIRKYYSNVGPHKENSLVFKN